MLKSPLSSRDEGSRMGCFRALALFLRALLVPKVQLAHENFPLRQQLAIFEQSGKRPRLRPRDRVFWAVVSRIWAGWRSLLVIVKPDTVVGWRRQGFRLYWRWKSRGRKRARPPVEQEIRDLIRMVLIFS